MHFKRKRRHNFVKLIRLVLHFKTFIIYKIFMLKLVSKVMKMSIPKYLCSFFSFQIWRDIYLFTMAILSVFTMIFQLHPKFFTRTWFHVRLCVYVGLTAYGIIPAVHWIYLNGGFSSHIVQVKMICFTR